MGSVVRFYSKEVNCTSLVLVVNKMALALPILDDRFGQLITRVSSSLAVKFSSKSAALSES